MSADGQPNQKGAKMDQTDAERRTIKQPFDTDFGQVSPDEHNLTLTGQEKQIVWHGRPTCGIEAQVRHNSNDDQVLGEAFFPFCILAAWTSAN